LIASCLSAAMRGSLLMLAGIHSTASIVVHSNCSAGMQHQVEFLQMDFICLNAFENDAVRVWYSCCGP
jgi:hypothetical protein